MIDPHEEQDMCALTESLISPPVIIEIHIILSNFYVPLFLNFNKVIVPSVEWYLDLIYVYNQIKTF